MPDRTTLILALSGAFALEGCIIIEDGSGASTTGEPTTQEVCAEYGARALECEGANLASYCVSQVEEYTASYGAACGAALEDYFACLSALDCPAFVDGVGCEFTFC